MIRALEKPVSTKAQTLSQKIHAALEFAKTLPTQDCVAEIRISLAAIQAYCETIEKIFIVVEERITCNQHDLSGSSQDQATLFRGPCKDASVAICITDRGSLLYRNSNEWQIYRNAGDL
ncbi:hypothetical protein [Leptolyngbya sp. NIES-2104]|uniref:hypothetical protein n=1 Tax=Leptolyngbya sp. NIES-2104 TaxID=1552121 RepID=UPI00073E3C1F|nr:hypothetical protein [Leptolyngbya sp. NIES-2104]